MIDEEGRRYFVYSLHRMYKNYGTIYLRDKEYVAIGYEYHDSVYILPFDRKIYKWTTDSKYHNHLKGQLAYYVAANPEEIYKYADILGEKANEIKLPLSEIKELGKILYEKTNNKKYSINRGFDYPFIYNPILAYIVPKNNENDAEYRIVTYEVGYVGEGTNDCTTLDGEKFKIFSTANDFELKTVHNLTPLEYIVDEAKDKYRKDELEKIEKEYNSKLKAEQKIKKQQEIDELEKKVREEIAEKKRKEAEAEAERLALEEKQRLEEEEQRRKEERIERLINTPQRIFNMFVGVNKENDNRLKAQYESFRQTAENSHERLETLDDKIAAIKSLKEEKNRNKNELEKTRNKIVENLGTIQELFSKPDDLLKDKLKYPDEELMMLMHYIEKYQKLIVEQEKLSRKKIILSEFDLIISVNGVREIKTEFRDYLDCIDLSTLSSKNLKASGYDWSQTNISLVPKILYNQDASNCVIADHNLIWKDLSGCNFENTTFIDEKESYGIENAITNEGTKYLGHVLEKKQNN